MSMPAEAMHLAALHHSAAAAQAAGVAAWLPPATLAAARAPHPQLAGLAWPPAVKPSAAPLQNSYQDSATNQQQHLPPPALAPAALRAAPATPASARALADLLPPAARQRSLPEGRLDSAVSCSSSLAALKRPEAPWSAPYLPGALLAALELPGAAHRGSMAEAAAAAPWNASGLRAEAAPRATRAVRLRRRS